MTRRRTAAGFAALIALTGALVFAGAMTAHADDVLEFDPALDNLNVAWTNTGFEFSGTSTGGDPTVTVWDDEETPLCSGPVVANAWSCTTANPLPVGAHSYTATQAIPDLPPAQDEVAIYVFPSAPSYDNANPYVIDEDAEAFFSGDTSAPDSVIQVTVDGIDPSCTTPNIPAPGDWSCSFSTAEVPPGEYTMRVRQTTGPYWSEASGPFIITDTVDFFVTSPAQAEAGSGFTVTGTADSDDTSAIDVRLGTEISGDLLCTAVWEAGAWSCEATPLGPGDYTITAWQETRTSPGALLSVLIPTPELDNPLFWTIDVGDDAAYSGLTTYANVDVTIDVESVGSCSTNGPYPTPGTAWQCLISAPPVGTYAVSIRQVIDGMPSLALDGILTVDPVLQITAPSGGVGWATGDFLVVSGTSPSPDQIDVYLDGDLVTPVCTIASPAPAEWACPAITLDPGPHTVTATQYLEDDFTAEFDVLLPAPTLPSALSFELGTTDATVAGTRAYAASTRVTVYEDFGEGVGAELATTTCPPEAEDTFSCVLDLSALAVDTYTVRAEHFLPGDPGVLAVYSETSLDIVSGEYTGPVLDCTFQPSGATISASAPTNFGIYSLVPSLDDVGWVLVDQGYCGGSAGYRDTSVGLWDDTPLSGQEGGDGCTTAGCTLIGLAPGIYEVYYSGAEGETEGDGSFDYLFRVPEAPTAVAASAGNSIAMSGTATPGDTVRVVGGSGATLCQTTATGAGTWGCGFAASTQTSARAISIDPQSGGLSAYSATRSIPVFVAPPVGEPDPPAPVLPTLVLWLLNFDGDLSNLRPGDTFSMTIEGMPQGWGIEVIMHSTPQSLGTAVATGSPQTLEFTVPDDIEAGPHRIEVIATSPLGVTQTQDFDATVVDEIKPVDKELETEPDEPGPTDGTGLSGGATVDRSNPAAPSALTDSIAPLRLVIDNPVTIAIAGGLALALLFLVALPTELLNSSLSSNSSRLGRVYGTFDRAMTRAQDWLIRVTRSRAVAAAALVVIVAIIYGFVDPGFGFDLVSLRLVLSLGIAFFILSFVASWISGIIIRRAWGAIGVVAMQPTIILFAVIGVIVARILEFSPGFLVGVAIGLELLQASKQVTARAVFVQIGVVTGLALAAWVVYSVFTPGDDFVGMLVDDTMVAVTAEGLTGALIAVFPLKFLDGRELWEVSKRLWAAAFLLVAVAFALLVLPTAVEGTDVADYGVWLLVFAVFGAVSLAVWVIFVRAEKRAAVSADRKIDA
jgi:hypothetical protein